MKQQALQQIRKLSKQLFNHLIIVMSIFAALCIGVAVNSINKNSGSGRDEEHYQSSIQVLKGFKFDDKAVSQIRNLTGKDFDIQPDLSDKRVNPFGQ